MATSALWLRLLSSALLLAALGSVHTVGVRTSVGEILGSVEDGLHVFRGSMCDFLSSLFIFMLAANV